MIFQNKSIISLIIICSTNTALANQTNTSTQKDKILVTASKIKPNSKQIDANDISTVRGTTN